MMTIANLLEAVMEQLSFVCGYHAYKDQVGSMVFSLEREPSNGSAGTVGHIPFNAAPVVSVFLRTRG